MSQVVVMTKNAFFSRWFGFARLCFGGRNKLGHSTCKVSFESTVGDKTRTQKLQKKTKNKEVAQIVSILHPAPG